MIIEQKCEKYLQQGHENLIKNGLRLECYTYTYTQTQTLSNTYIWIDRRLIPQLVRATILNVYFSF